ncbi:hypothetical protein MAR_027037 [Mya arenaria]|uniref:Uncharacterized protein n=1 Tax=Mya arenaria TaxID=6604 RepID=A0ABY7EUE8_MYAAR|nr:hypothetical protein MAR_027037 [Mya arenaria]
MTITQQVSSNYSTSEQGGNSSREITQQVSREVTQQVSREVTQQVSMEVSQQVSMEEPHQMSREVTMNVLPYRTDFKQHMLLFLLE